MFKNHNYIGIDAIASQISSMLPGVEIDKSTIMDWAGWAQMYDMVIIREWFLFRDVPLAVDQKKALIPCNCHKLLDVYNRNKNRLKYRKDGSYLFFAENHQDAFISYRGFPVDEEGRPLFIRGTERALARYCIMNYHEQDFMSGKMDGQRWQYLVEKWEDERDVARVNLRNLSRNDIESILQINADMIPKLGHIPLYNLD